MNRTPRRSRPPLRRACHALWATAALLASQMAWPAAAQAALAGADADQAPVRIGVLSVLDDPDTQRQWQPLQRGLGAALPSREVQLQPLSPEGLEQAVAARRLDYVITNPGHYVLLETRHGATRIATQASANGEDPAHAVGSALVTRRGGSARPLGDWHGQRIAAVSDQAFGGYQLIAAEWLRTGLDAERGDVKRLFTGYPMTRVIDAVLDGRADAGIVRTCLIERLVTEGRLAPDALEVVEPRRQPGLPCRSSTPLYPGWAFAALPGVAHERSREVMLALLALPADAGGSRWTVPADYQRVHDVLRTLEVEPYGFLRATRLESLARRYWYVLGSALALIGLIAAYTLRVEVLVKRRTAELTRSLAERDRLARQLERDHEAMDHLARLSILGELSATLGHELNQPLATIANYAAGLQRRTQRQTLSAKALQQALADIAGEAERAARVLDGIRALARKRVGQRRAGTPQQWIDEALALFRGMQAQAPEVQVSAPPDADGLTVVADALQMQQVLLNLLKNAQDAHRAGGHPQLPITLRLARDGEQLCLAVQDAGPALDAAQHGHLFEPFYTTKPGGLGLGLPICRTIVEAHGGSLQARAVDESGQRGGMIFEVRLPLAAPDRSATPPA